MTDRFIEVAPAIPLPATSRQTYTYRLVIAPDEPLAYRPVRIPLGTRRVRGFIVNETTMSPPYPLKAAQLLPEAALTPAQVALAEWLHTTQRGGLGYTLRLFVPPLEATPLLKKARRLPRPQAVIHIDAKKRWVVLARRLQPYLKKHQSVLMIVPEKWQLAPLAAALTIALGQEPLILHAALKKSLLRRAVTAITHRTPLIIGTQKALFMPYPALGAVVLEEENYPTHKLWDQYPRLSNWYGVERLAAAHHAALLYSSSFPSVRLYGQIQASKVASTGRLPARPGTTLLPQSFTRRQPQSQLPPPVIDCLRHWLQKKHVGLVHTLAPERALKLRRTLHQIVSRSAHLTVGTPTDIVSQSTTPYDELLWLFPETLLRYPDYRSREQTYTLLHRLAHLLPAQHPLHLVTYFPRLLEEELLLAPQHYFQQELKARQLLNYPPFADVVRLTITNRTPQQAEHEAEKIRRRLDKSARHSHVILRGPVASMYPANYLERHLILRGALPTLTSLYHDIKITRADLDPFKVL